MFLNIQSNQNEKVKLFKSLSSMKKARQETGLFLLEGKKLISEALESNYKIKYVIALESCQNQEQAFLETLEKSGAQIYLCQRAALESATSTHSPQNIVAAAEMQILEFNMPESGFFVGLDSVQDPGNMGTTIRSADAFGVDGVLCSTGCADLYSPKVIRSCAGSIFHVPVYSVDLNKATQELKDNNFEIIAAELLGAQALPEKLEKALLLIGSEGRGLSQELLHMATIRYKLEMRGRAESLNAAVCAGIIMNDLSKKF